MSNINLGLDMSSLETGLQQAVVSGVLLHAGQDAQGNTLDYLAGSNSGNVLEITVPGGNLTIAQTVLDGLKLRGFRYQPFESDGAIADPAIEIGDNVTVNGTHSVIMGRSVKHSRLMSSTLKAPFDEEVNHEFKFETRSERNFRRESAYTRSQLKIAADEIEAKVSKVGGDNSSFGWRLTSDSWDLFSSNSTVLHATKDGIEVKGRITATSGYIGSENNGFLIDSYGIRKGMTSLSDAAHNGVYIGTDGISLGGGKFKVDSAGNLTASSGTFTGNVYAKNIQYGGDYGTMGGGGITAGSIGTGTGSPLSSYAIGGIGGGVNFADMTQQKYTADWLVANHIVCFTPGHITGSHYGFWADDSGEYGATWQSKKIASDVSVSATATARVWVTTNSGNAANVVTAVSGSGSLSYDTEIKFVGR